MNLHQLQFFTKKKECLNVSYEDENVLDDISFNKILIVRAKKVSLFKDVTLKFVDVKDHLKLPRVGLHCVAKDSNIV